MGSTAQGSIGRINKTDTSWGIRFCFGMPYDVANRRYCVQHSNPDNPGQHVFLIPDKHRKDKIEHEMDPYRDKKISAPAVANTNDD